MKTKHFTWDESKRLSNLRKHGLDFADAWKVFSGSMTNYIDQRYPYDEIRFQALGFLGIKPVSIIYTENEYEIRVISFRKTTRAEERVLARDLAD